MTKQAQLLFQEVTNDGPIEIWQEGNHRLLRINGVEQSRLDINHPDKLASPLDYYFLGCLLFINPPNNVLLGGLGGGTIAHFLHHKDYEISGLAIEINPLIAKLAKEYFQFPKYNWEIVIENVQQNNFSISPQLLDLILIDIGERHSTPEWLISSNQLSQLKNKLSENGVLVINLLVENAEEFSQMFLAIRQVFNSNTLFVTVPEHKNIVIYAFNKRPIYHSSDQLQSRVKTVSDKWGLNYAKFLDQILQENPAGSGIL